MLKKLFLLAIVSCAAIAVADHILVVGSEGHGSALTSDGRRGNFDYRAVKTTAPHHRPRFDGQLRFEQLHTSAHRGVLIEMGRPSFVGVSGNVCEFGGAGVMRVQTASGHHELVRGRVSVRVVDNRHPHHEHEHDPDIFRIHFASLHGNISYSFEGLVDHGDLAVFSRHSH